MKKAILSTLLLLLVFSGCTELTGPEEQGNPASLTTLAKTASPEVQENIENVFSFDQTPKQFLLALKEAGLELNAASDTSDGRRIEREGYFMYVTDDLRVMYNPEDKPTFFTVLSPKFTTDLGLRVGDSKEKMLSLYGSEYTQGDGHVEWYSYEKDDLGIGFHIKQGLVYSWSISILSERVVFD